MVWRDFFKFGIFTLILSIRIRNRCVRSACASVSYAHAVLDAFHWLISNFHLLAFQFAWWVPRFLTVTYLDVPLLWLIFPNHEKYLFFINYLFGVYIHSLMHVSQREERLRVNFLTSLLNMYFVLVCTKLVTVYSACFSVLTRTLSTRMSSWVLTRMLSARMSSRRACSVRASVPYAHAQGIQNEHLKNGKTDAHAEHARKELMSTLSVRISSWPVCSTCA